MTLRACAISGLVRSMSYMIDPIAEAYGIIFMFALSSRVFGDILLERDIPCLIGMRPLLEFSMLNLLTMVSMYLD